MNMTMRKVVSSMFEQHKLFFIDVGSYRDIPLQNCPLFSDFRPLKSQSRDWAPPNLMCIQSPTAPTLCSNFIVPHLANL